MNNFILIIVAIFFILSCSPASDSIITQSGSTPTQANLSNCYDNQITSTTILSPLKGFVKSLFCFTTSILTTEVFAAQAEPGYCDKYKKMEGPQLTVTWDSKDKPQAVGWIGSVQCIKVPAQADSIKIDRVGWGKVPDQLLVVPKDSNLQPKILDIAKNQKKIHFSTQKINADEIWLWGNTLKSPCERDGCPSVPMPYKVGIKSPSYTLTSVFLQKLQLSGQNSPTLEFYSDGIDTSNIDSVSIEGFQSINKTSLTPNDSSFGKSAEVKITHTKGGQCPSF